MAAEVARIRAAGPSTPVELNAMFINLANTIVARASFGNVQGNAENFLSAISAGVVLTSGFTVPDLFPTWRPVLAAVTGMRHALEQVHRTVDTTLQGMIKERRRIRGTKRQGEQDENLVDVLLGLQERGGLGFNLTENSIKAVLFDMFSAGSGTLAASLSWGMSELMLNKRAMSKLQGEIRQAFHGKATVTEADIQASSLPYLKLVIKETLRLHPPAPLLVPRESIEACEIEGYTVPARSRVVVNVWAIGRDPKCWDDADEFKPERFEDGMVDFNGTCYEYLPFGAGRRMCPGIAYALPVMETMLVQLLYHFDWLLPDGVSELDMAEMRGLGARRKSPLLLCATPFAIPESTTSEVPR
jgi:cytochrome P450